MWNVPCRIMEHFADEVEVQLPRGTLLSLSRNLWPKPFIEPIVFFGEFGWRPGHNKLLEGIAEPVFDEWAYLH